MQRIFAHRKRAALRAKLGSAVGKKRSPAYTAFSPTANELHYVQSSVQRWAKNARRHAALKDARATILTHFACCKNSVKNAHRRAALTRCPRVNRVHLAHSPLTRSVFDSGLSFARGSSLTVALRARKARSFVPRSRTQASVRTPHGRALYLRARRSLTANRYPLPRCARAGTLRFASALAFIAPRCFLSFATLAAALVATSSRRLTVDTPL